MEILGGWQAGPWLMVLMVFMAWVVGITLLKKVIFSVVRSLTDKTANKLDDLFLNSLDFPLQLIAYASGVLVVEHLIPQESGSSIFKYLLEGFKVVSIAAGVIFVDKSLQGLLQRAESRVDILRTSGGFARGFVRVVIVGLGVLILLDTLGVSITPIIASLGIGSLAVALALQPTLENFFSGIQLIADKPIQVGQMVRLESGEEGTVIRIGWRSTWIGLPNNNTIVIPNKLLVNSRVTNYFYPNAEVGFAVSLGVAYDSDLERVEHVVGDVAREVMKAVPGGIANFEPVVRYQSFGDFSIVFSVGLRARDWAALSLVRHEFIKRLHRRFIMDGIQIPFPTQIVVAGK